MKGNGLKSSWILLVLINGFFLPVTHGQDVFYRFSFTDKNGNGYDVSRPNEFLSQRCIDRRQKWKIPIDERDLPLNDDYVDALVQITGGRVHSRSKWFNEVVLQLSDSSMISVADELPFIRQAIRVKSRKKPLTSISQKSEATDIFCSDDHFYGKSCNQIAMLNGQSLHNMGFTGRGIHIAQLDAGWLATDRLPCFRRLYDENRLVTIRDFAYPQDENVYSQNSHGTSVLSIMASYWPDSLIGAAPDATYHLFRSEDPLSETNLEEDNWVAAAELADSIGADIINSSLGYSLFDSAWMNYTYADMDGNIARCTQGAEIAAEKGIIVVNSAGNSGLSAWHHITAPSDGDNVLAIGAVDADKVFATFSGWGPSADGDVKPDVCAQGRGTYFAGLDSTVKKGNGTSFSSPLVAGMAACLMQAAPDRSPFEVREAIKKSAHLYNVPNDSLGYGIPDMMKALAILRSDGSSENSDWLVYPNPFLEDLNVIVPCQNPPCDLNWSLLDASGKEVIRSYEKLNAWGMVPVNIKPLAVSSGKYSLVLEFNNERRLFPIIKIKP
jgi:hypothetical protein